MSHALRETVALAHPSPNPLAVLMPLFNDWEAFVLVMERLRKGLPERPRPCQVVVADDGSTTELEPQAIERCVGGPIVGVTILRLARNLGHQRALAIGLTYICNHYPGHDVVVMDSDGEDAPEDIPRLLAASQRAPSSIVFAGRASRSEGVMFSALYRCYVMLHRVLTGTRVSFGNFSVVPAGVLSRLVCLSELWNHYPAAVLKARLPIVTVPVARRSRIAGRSKMNVVALVLHGLSAIAVAGDVVGVRALVTTSVAIALTLVAMGLVLAIRLATDLAIPGWATYAAGLLIAILLQMVGLALVFVFMTLQSRNYATFLPQRDYHYFLAEVRHYS